MLPAVLLAGMLLPVVAKLEEGSLPTREEFREYVGKFCYDYKLVKNGRDKPIVGEWTFTVRGAVEEGLHDSRESTGPPCWGRCQTQGRFYLMAFDDQRHRWSKARSQWDQLSCEELHHVSNWAEDLSGPLSKRRVYANTLNLTESIRPRFWYFAFVNCGARVREPMSFSLHMANTLQGFTREFGIDRQKLIHIYATFWLLFAILGFFLYVSAKQFHQSFDWNLNSWPQIRLLQLSSWFSASGCVFFLGHCLIYASNGRGLPLLAMLGTLCAASGKCVVTFLLFSIARGWALLTSPGNRRQRNLIVGVLVGIVAISMGCEFHVEFFHDQSTSFYLYDSWPGLVILLMNFFLFAWCLVTLWGTFSAETCEEVRCFYRFALVICLLFFISLPATCVTASLISPWYRRQWAIGIELATRCAVTAALVHCLQPSRLNALSSARLMGDQISFKDEDAMGEGNGDNFDEDNMAVNFNRAGAPE